MLSVDADGEPVGFALLTRCHIGDTPALCLAPCAVLPQYQRTGAGSAAIRAVLDAAKQRGEHFVTVLGHPEYYPRFGFTRASAHDVRMNVVVPEDALMVLALGGRPDPGRDDHLRRRVRRHLTATQHERPPRDRCHDE